MILGELTLLGLRRCFCSKSTDFSGLTVRVFVFLFILADLTLFAAKSSFSAVLILISLFPDAAERI
jgi:hypothetical protein